MTDHDQAYLLARAAETAARARALRERNRDLRAYLQAVSGAAEEMRHAAAAVVAQG